VSVTVTVNVFIGVPVDPEWLLDVSTHMECRVHGRMTSKYCVDCGRPSRPVRRYAVGDRLRSYWAIASPDVEMTIDGEDIRAAMSDEGYAIDPFGVRLFEVANDPDDDSPRFVLGQRLIQMTADREWSSCIETLVLASFAWTSFVIKAVLEDMAPTIQLIVAPYVSS